MRAACPRPETSAVAGGRRASGTRARCREGRRALPALRMGAPSWAADLDCGAHQDEPSYRVENRLQQHSAHDHDRQHDQRVRGAARKNAIGNLKEIDRNGEYEDVARIGEKQHHQHVFAHRGEAGGEAFGKVGRAEPAVKLIFCPVDPGDLRIASVCFRLLAVLL